jgi:S-adenosylmethionine decarboxylase
MKTNGPFASHMLLELHGCDAELLNNPEALKGLLLEAVRRGHGTIVTDVFHTFSPHGVSGVVVIAESHVAIHTWPEAGFVTVDVYVCNYTTDNTDKAERLFQALEAVLKPSRKRFQAIHRGGHDD